MTKIKKINKGIRSKLEYVAEKNQEIDRLEYETVNSRLSDILINVKSVNKHKGFVLEYDISDTISMKDYLKMMPVNKKTFISFLEQIIGLVKFIDEKSMDLKKVLFDLDYVRVLPSEKKLLFVYIPAVPCEFEESEETFIQNMLKNVIFSQYEDNSYVMKLLDIINSRETFSMYKIDVYVDDLKNINPPTATLGKTKKRCPVCHTILNKCDVFCSLCGTRLMDSKNGVYIVRKSSQEKIYMDSYPFYFGKRKDLNGYFIRDNVMISRIHAQIIKENNNYFLCDMGSTNGTYVNKKRLMPNERYKLKNGTVFLLAKEEFVFYL